MTAVTSQMNRMVLLCMLILSMVSLPTSLPKHLLVETADNQGGDDYEEPKPEISPDFMGHFTIDQFDKGELSISSQYSVTVDSQDILCPFYDATSRDMIYGSNY